MPIGPEVRAQMAQWEQWGCWAYYLAEVKWAATIPPPCLAPGALHDYPLNNNEHTWKLQEDAVPTTESRRTKNGG